MRAPSVAPREADAVGSLKVCRGGTAVGETREEGGKFNCNKRVGGGLPPRPNEMHANVREIVLADSEICALRK